ncbi:MAG: hypothetical protein K2X36_10345 [Microbacteriaceae bacterium]|nr:hypothetical protein [Microbacteriaceae bacterium]
MKRLGSLLTFAVTALLVTHVALTAFENSPDTKVSLGSRIPWLNRLPQWRFFAPNPGVENTHVLYRSSDEAGGWTRWQEIPYRNRLKWYSFLWNPGSRAPKALFDTSQQLMVLAGYGASYEWAIGSTAYLLLQDVVRDICRSEQRHGQFQFMIMSSRPGSGPEGMHPILASEPAPVEPTGARP